MRCASKKVQNNDSWQAREANVARCTKYVISMSYLISLNNCGFYSYSAIFMMTAKFTKCSNNEFLTAEYFFEFHSTQNSLLWHQYLLYTRELRWRDNIRGGHKAIYSRLIKPIPTMENRSFNCLSVLHAFCDCQKTTWRRGDFIGL